MADTLSSENGRQNNIKDWEREKYDVVKEVNKQQIISWSQQVVWPLSVKQIVS